MIETESMRITSPLKISSFTLGGFTVFALTVTVLLVVTCADADGAASPDAATPSNTTKSTGTIRLDIFDIFVQGDFERLQKLDVLRCNIDLCFLRALVEHFFVHANMQRFEEASVRRRHLRFLRGPLRQANRRVQLQHNVVAG